MFKYMLTINDQFYFCRKLVIALHKPNCLSKVLQCTRLIVYFIYTKYIAIYCVWYNVLYCGQLTDVVACMIRNPERWCGMLHWCSIKRDGSAPEINACCQPFLITGIFVQRAGGI